jgi:hypothetical protein
LPALVADSGFQRRQLPPGERELWAVASGGRRIATGKDQEGGDCGRAAAVAATKGEERDRRGIPVAGRRCIGAVRRREL